MVYLLTSAGYGLTPDLAAAEVILINTCAFIEPARVEAVDAVIEAGRYKKDGKCRKLLVAGCLPQKYKTEIAADLPEVDAFLTAADYDGIVSALARLYGEPEPAASAAPVNNCPYGRFLTTPPHYAYLKIADGCDNKCAYCTIPSIRGPYRSRDIQSLVDEAQSLADGGVRELILVAQDVTRYGADLNGEYGLIDLLRRLSRLPITRIRLMYCYPELVTDGLIREIDSNPKIAKYIDIPLQHVSDSVLKRMNRKSTRKSIEALLAKIRAANNYISVRTTLMTGFPGETEDDFAEMCDFLRLHKPDNVGFFAYSDEEDAPAYRLPDKIDEDEKRRRLGILGELHLANAREAGKKAVGKTLAVLYEDIDFDKNMFVGRTEYNAPEIDSRVYFTGGFADAGREYDVLITGYNDYDLTGEMATNESAD
jgi:ribosomal protein S12 methylthiotransferase